MGIDYLIGQILQSAKAALHKQCKMALKQGEVARRDFPRFQRTLLEKAGLPLAQAIPHPQSKERCEGIPQAEAGLRMDWAWQSKVPPHPILCWYKLTVS